MKQLLIRKLSRLLALVYPIVYLNYSQGETIFLAGIIAAVAMIIESTRFYSGKVEKLAEKVFSPMGKDEEVRRLSGITYLALGALFTVIFFEKVIAVPHLVAWA